MPVQFIAYNAAFLALLAACLPILPLLLLFFPGKREGLLNRLGFISFAFKAKVYGKKNIWIHSASAGEIKCALELAAELKKKYPASQIVFTTTGINGQRMIKNTVQNAVACYLPLDFYFFIKPLVKIIKPEILVIVETEYWPNLFYLAKRAGAKIVAVNGRFSESSIKRYRLIRPLIKKTFSFVDLFGMRSPEDAAALLFLGGEAGKIVVTGDLKNEIPVLEPLKKQVLEAVLKPVLNEKTVVFGSVHAAEIPQIKEVIKQLREKTPGVSVIIAPRFLEEIPEFVKMLEEAGVKYIRRSGLKSGSAKMEAVILDTIGELSLVYGLGTAAFVGGSFADGIGGHNLLEPVYFGKPVFFGPYAYNYKDMAEEVKLSLVGFKVKDAFDMAMKINDMLADTSLPAKIAEAAQVLLEKKKGSLAKTLALI